MASPPYSHNYGTSVSPPYPAHSQLPSSSKKRPSEMSPAPAVKRRKASILSTSSNLSAHPLRQTSFPPDGGDQYSQAVRSPSVDTTSLVSASVADVVVKKKRGRKPKGYVEDTTSTAGGRALTTVSGTSGPNRRNISRGMSAEEDDDDDEALDVAIVTHTTEEKEKEKYYRSMLVDALDPDQYARYERWRSSKLPDSIVRRIVNQTLSQSAPGSIILAVKSVTKIFAGEIIERARKVQTQWLELSDESQTGLPSPPASDNEEKAKETRRGPLMADHLREALRRYKLERDGGFVGLLNLDKVQHPTGAERFGLRSMGKRLLK